MWTIVFNLQFYVISLILSLIIIGIKENGNGILWFMMIRIVFINKYPVIIKNVLHLM